MEVTETPLAGVRLLKPRVFRDGRGEFFESWNARDFCSVGITTPFVQDNVSRSERHVLRGMHYQVRHPQGKLLQVVLGAVFDVVIDLRTSSPSFGRWFGVELEADSRTMLWVPPGVAHGYLALSADVVVHYKCTDYYCPEHERCILWSDPDVGIRWPPMGQTAPILSRKDACASRFRDAEYFP